jgi:Rrf2 family iron-sulfur cluster assembly transcriptional regulator
VIAARPTRLTSTACVCDGGDPAACTLGPVKLSKSARYALYAASEMASAGDRPVTVGEVAQAYGIPTAALAKIFQQLVRSGLAAGTRGVGGGYRLARRAKDVTLLDVLHVYDAPRSDDACLLADGPALGSCRRSAACRLRRLFDEVDEMVRCTFASVSLATLAGTNVRDRVAALSARAAPATNAVPARSRRR